MWKRLFATSALVVAGGGAAMAQDLSFGLGLTSEYVGRGAAYSNGPAIQPWAEVEMNGFYAGFWASNIDDPVDTFELELYAGYSWDLSGTSLDLGYAHYFTNSGSIGGELFALIEHATDDFRMFGGLYIDDATWSVSDLHVGFGATFMESFELSGRVGTDTAGTNYGDIGVTYAKDAFELDLRYHTSNTGLSMFVLSTGISF